MPGPLAGIRIFDLTRILAGPTATQILADLGADVIKIERPGLGDDVRAWGPPFLKTADGSETRESVYYQCANRNKRSITLDLAKPEGQALARRMIAQSDVLFENYKVGDLAKYGLAYDQLRGEFPRLIYCSLTGFGQTGPYAPRAGFDLVVQAMGGIMSITGHPGGEPAKVGVGIADVMTGMYCNIAILAALRHRDATGQGQQIDMALLDCQMAWLINEGMNHLHTGRVPTPMGTAHATIVPYQAVPAADGYFILGTGTERQFRAFCDYVGDADFYRDARFSSNAQRVRNRVACLERVSAHTGRRPIGHWLDELTKLSIPCGPVNTIDKAFADPQVKARNMVVELPHSATGKAEKYIASPIKMSATPPEYRRAAPMLGEHTEDVLGEMLGLGKAEVAGLRSRGVV